MPLLCSDEMNVFAESANGEMRHISEVVSGLKCNCTCPGCGEAMVAYKGKTKKAHYFGHRAGSDCKTGRETALHKFAKDVLNGALELTLPPIDIRVDDKSLTFVERKVFSFERADLEKRTSDIIPDVVVYLKGRPLLVEMFVTHQCDNEKIEKIVRLGISAIEIDLSKVSQKAELSVWKDAVLHSAHRTWLYNSAAQNAEQQAQALADARRTAALEAKQKAIAALVAEIERLRLVTTKTPDHKWQHQIEGFDLRSHADVSIAGDFLFSGSDGQWKSHVLDQWVYRMMDTPTPEATFVSKNVVSSLQSAGLIKRGIPDLSAEDLPEVKALIPDFAPVPEVVGSYLNHLRSVRVLENTGGVWTVHPALQSSYDAENQRRWDREDRTEEVKDAVTRVLDLVPVEETKGFDFERWLHTDQPTLDGASIFECINSDHDGFTYPFYSLLKKLEAMVAGKGEPAEHLLNLPLAPARTRQINKLRDEAEQAEAARERALTEAKKARIKQLEEYVASWPAELFAAHWMIAPDEQLNGRTPRSQAEESDIGLRKALDLARTVFEVWQAKAKEIAIKASWQRQIMAVAENEALSGHAKLWLTTPNRRYSGRKPFDLCTSEAVFLEMSKHLREDMKAFKGPRY